MKLSTDWTRRVQELNDYVNEQYAAMDTTGQTVASVTEYLCVALAKDEDYEIERGDYEVIQQAVQRHFTTEESTS